MPDARDEVFAAMAGRKKPKPRSSKRDARRGLVACTAACARPNPECLCTWGCWIAAGEKAKPEHIRLALNWACSEHGKPGVPTCGWRDDPTIVRPMNGGPA